MAKSTLKINKIPTKKFKVIIKAPKLFKKLKLKFPKAFLDRLIDWKTIINWTKTKKIEKKKKVKKTMLANRSKIIKKLREAVRKRGLERERKKLQKSKENFLTPREKLRLVKRKSKKKRT